MDKELTACVLMVWPKIPQMPQKISAQNIEIFEKKNLGVCSPWIKRWPFLNELIFDFEEGLTPFFGSLSPKDFSWEFFF